MKDLLANRTKRDQLSNRKVLKNLESKRLFFSLTGFLNTEQLYKGQIVVRLTLRRQLHKHCSFHEFTLLSKLVLLNLVNQFQFL